MLDLRMGVILLVNACDFLKCLNAFSNNYFCSYFFKFKGSDVYKEAFFFAPVDLYNFNVVNVDVDDEHKKILIYCDYDWRYDL